MALEVKLDNAFSKLDTLKQFAPNFAMEAMQKGGTSLRKAMVNKAKSMGTHNWGTEYHNGHKRVTFGKSKKQAYSREGNRVSGNNSNLGEFIRMQGYDASLKVLVGFMNERKGFKSYRYKDGEKTPYTRVSGVFVKKIGQKMEHGGKEILTDKQKNFFRASGMGGIAKRGYVNRKARPIVRPTFNAMRGNIISEIEKSYRKSFTLVENGSRRVS
jgi:hypothetical protein